LAPLVPVEGRRDVPPTALGSRLVPPVAVTFPDVGVERAAILVLGGRAPGLALCQRRLDDVLLVAGAAECRRIEAGRTFRRHPLRAAWGQSIVCPIERDLFDREALTADCRLELEVALRLRLVDEGTVAEELHGDAVITDLSRHLEV